MDLEALKDQKREKISRRMSIFDVKSVVDGSKSLAKANPDEHPKPQSFFEVVVFDLKKLTYENMSLQELCLVGVREQKKNIAGHHPEEDG